MSNALNSGALNEVPFPGSEDGLSLVQMIATVQVDCTMGDITLIRNATATTSARARVYGVGTEAQFLLGASGQAQARPAEVTALRKIRILGAATTVATVRSEASCNIKARLGADTAASAEVSVRSYNAGRVNAATTARAFVSSPPAVNYVFRAAATLAQARTTVNGLRKRPSSASATGRCDGTARIQFTRQIGAPTQTSALGFANNYVKRRTSATTTARATPGSAESAIKRRVSARATPGAYAQPALGTLAFRPGAATSPRATGTARALFRIQASASTTARAIAQSAAMDYGIAMPSPAERLMFVQASERYMEVKT